MFDLGASDSQTDASPEETPQGYGPVSMALSLKFLPDHVSHLRVGLGSTPVQTPKERLFKGDLVDNIDDVGYESGHESFMSTMKRVRPKVFTKKRRVPDRRQGFIQPESSISEDACAVLAQEVRLLKFSVHDCSSDSG